MSDQWVSIAILDLDCAASAIALERRLARLPGVREVAVNPATDAAYVRYDDETVTASRLGDAIVNEGYRILRPGGR